jgi:hypothetical protein
MRNTSLFAAALFMACGSVAFAANTDELWEISNTMEMQGMAMPSRTQTSCIARNQAYKPEAEDKNCTVSDLKIAGNKTSWKMQCTGKDAMEGSGVMTKTATTLNGVMTMKTGGEQMTMKMSGRIVGKCSAAAEQKKMDGMIADANAKQAEAQAQMKEMQRKSCEETRKSASENFDRYETYKQFESGSPEMRSYLAKCKVNLEASRKQLCDKATVGQHEFAKKYCPDEYAAMKIQHCTGRSSSFRDLCDDASSAGQMDSAAASGNDNPAKAVLDGAKGLLNVFGF